MIQPPPPAHVQVQHPHRGAWTVSELQRVLALTDWQTNQIRQIAKNIHQGFWRRPKDARIALWRQVNAVLTIPQQELLRTLNGPKHFDVVD